MQTKIKLVQERVAELVFEANKIFNITLPPIDVRFDLKGRAAGQACSRNGLYWMRFNTTMMMTEAWDHIYNETISHELAHIICFSNRHLGRNHDAGWKRVHTALGGNGKRCHNELVIYGKGKTYRYTSTGGKVVHISQKMHETIQRGSTITLKSDGKLTRECECQLVGIRGRLVEPQAISKSRMPAGVSYKAAPQATRATTPSARTKTEGTSKAARVRARMTEAKLKGEGQEVVVQWIILNCEMSKGLATKYYVENLKRI
jgi:SprT protein